MKLQKKSSKVTSQEVTYEATTTNFVIAVIARIGNENILQNVEGTAKRKSATDAMPNLNSTFNKYGVGQLSTQFPADLATEEQIELLQAYNDIITTLNAPAV